MAKQEFQTDLYQIRQDPAKIMRDIDERRGGDSVYVGDKGKFDASSRNFFGSTTKMHKGKCGKGGPCGPAMDGSKVPSNFGDGGTTHEGQGMVGSSGATAGAAGAVTAQTASINLKGNSLVENRAEKFLSFVESLRTDDNQQLLESVLEGFVTILEAEKWMQKSQKSGEVKKGKMHSLLRISQDKDVSDVYKSGAGLYNALTKKVGDAAAMKMINYAANTAGNQLYVSARAYGKKKNDKN